LLGGIWIIQTLPAMLIGLYTRWFNPWALLIGWAIGTATGTWMAWSVNFATSFALHVGDWTFPGYTALYTLILNLVLAIVLTPVMNAISAKRADSTVAADYYA
jgi:solute:Na+ symporter, SSS family